MNKNIKAFFLIIFLGFSLGARGQANTQQINGIYLTEDDYKNNRLGNEAPTDKENFIVVELGTLKMFRNGVKTTFRPGSIYGYFQNGRKYRGYRKHLCFDRFGYYKVIDDSGLIVYSLKSSSHKTSGNTFHYYSTEFNLPITRITKRAIRKSFSAYPEFVAKVSEGVSDKSVLTVDEQGQTTLNRLYNQFVKAKE